MSYKAAAPTRNMFKVFRSIPTRWRDNDVYGHVNNVVYYEYFDTAVNGFLMDATGVDIRALPAIGVVVETGCKYFKSISFPDVLDIGLSVTRVWDSSVQYRLGVFQAGASRAAADGRFVHVYVDAETRNKVSMPDIIRQSVLPLFEGAQ